MIKINLEKLLHKSQLGILKALKRFSIVVAGRRYGKTRLACIILLLRALDDVGTYWWIAPTYKIADIGWKLFKYLVRPIRASIKEGDKKVVLPNGSEIYFKSADNPDNLRGEGLKGVIFDEAAYVKEDVWISIIRPALADNQGWAVFISTPNGKNWFYNLFVSAENDEEWITFTKPTSENPYIDEGEIAAAKATTPDYVFSQEYLARFIDDGLSVFRNIRKACSLTSGTADPSSHKGHQIYMGVDLAKQTDFSVIIGICKDCKEQVLMDRFNQIDYIFQRKRLDAHYGRWKPKGIVVETNNTGIPFIEELLRMGLPIIEFTTTSSSKPELIEALSIAIEGLEVKLQNNKVLKNELGAYAMTTNKLGRHSYSAPAGLHDDTVMALALAWYGVVKYQPLEIIAF